VVAAEFEVLEGTINTLRKAKPVVAFEHGRLHGHSGEVFVMVASTWVSA